MNNSKHIIDRNNFFSTIPNFWHDLSGEPYALYDTYSLSNEKITELRIASKKIGEVFDFTAQILRQLPVHSLKELGIPESLLHWIQVKHLPFEGVIRRLDLSYHAGEWKLLEMNADTPTFIKECFHVNNKLCEHLEKSSPNTLQEELLAQILNQSIAHALHAVQEKGCVVFSAHDCNEEDWQTIS
ncbi:MAG: glutathionylspermidine synthase family protein, partial [Bacilli bacterium]